MRRTFSVMAIALAVCATGTPAAGSRSDIGANHLDAVCGTVAKKFTYLFWPKGHTGLPTSFPDETRGFPDLSQPHVSVYRPDADYPDDNWLVTVQVLRERPAEGGSKFVLSQRVRRSATTRACGSAHGAKWKPHIAHRETTRKATALNCRFRTTYGYVGFGDVGTERMKVRAHDKFTVFLEADTAADTPRLRYNTRFCKRIALPH